MHISRLFILRPIATSLLMVAILLSGLMAYRILPVASLPEVDYPTIQVATLYPGASPEVVTSAITAPLEKQLGQMPGLKQMSSSSSGGASVITLQFDLSLSLDIAEQEVQGAINAATSLLPSDLPAAPVYSKVNPADAPVVTLAISSKTRPLPKVQDLVDTRLAQKLSQLPGVGLVSLAGGQRSTVRIRVNARALASLGLTLDDVRTAITNANVNIPKGSFDGPTIASTIDANDQLKSASEFRTLIIAYRNGSAIRLSDIAQTVDDAENIYLGAWAGSHKTGLDQAIIVNIQRQPGANVIDVVDRIKQQLPQLIGTLPTDLDVQWLTDRTLTIRAAVDDVQIELLWAVILVVMVIFIFLRSARATLIPSLAVPLSLVGTFGIMYLAGFSLNNLTLMALTIATGFVVDDAIVMVENIARYIDEGEAPFAAAMKGSKQIGFTIISLTLSLIAVLIPLLFMSDVVGRLFREFAITLAIAILISAFISLTLTPMLCAFLLKHIPEKAQQDKFYKIVGAFFDGLIKRYGVALKWVLAHQGLTLWVAFITLALTALLYVWVPKGFFPVQDTGMIQGISQAPQSISYAAMAQRQQSLVSEILRDPAVASVSSFIGVDGTNATLNNGRLFINLKPHGQRHDDAQTIAQRLQEAIKQRSDIRLYTQPIQDLTIEDTISRNQYQFTLSSADPQALSMWTARLLTSLQHAPQFSDITHDLQEQGLRAYVEIDRDSAARLGVTPAAIDNALYNAFGQRLISTIFTQSNQYRVVLEGQESKGLENFNDIYISAANASGNAMPVPLTAVARIHERTGPLAVNHLGQFPATTFSFNLARGVPLGEAVKTIRDASAAIHLPDHVQMTFQGAAAAFQNSLANTLWLILAAVVTMYIVLGILYESYIHPVTILSTLPSAGVGALLALILSGHDLSIVAIIGIILLIGIVKKNAIMMIDFALEAERVEGKSPIEAIYQAALLRFRPILMTTFAALLSALPMMLGTGVGSELRRPLGMTMVGGLLLSQVLTLFTTPVIYLFFDRLSEKFSHFRMPRESMTKQEMASHQQELDG